MTELIKITENNGKKAVNARDLYDFLQVETPFHKWMPRMLEYGFMENTDWTKMSSENQSFNMDYVLSLDCAKEISMLQRTEKGKEARQYFIECEKQLKAVTSNFVLPKTYLEALKALVVAEETNIILKEEKQLAETKITELTPKAEVFDLTMSSGDNLSMGQTAKIIGYDGRNKLFKELRNRKILDARNVPYQQYVDLKYFELKEKAVKVKDETFVVPVTHVTQKGMAWLCKILKIESVQNVLQMELRQSD